MVEFIWNNYDQQSVFLCKPGLPSIELRPGDFITSGFYPDGVKIIKFYGIITEVGPRGFTYLPWNAPRQMWMGPPISIREDTRYILCEPAGKSHPGIPICAELIEKRPLPDLI